MNDMPRELGSADIQQVLELLPHRYPFLMIDRIIEIDGDDHATKPERDAQRTRFLESEGYVVIRFANADVMTNLDGVVARIGANLASKQKGGTA